MAAGSKNTDRIVSAALKLLQERDYASVTVKDICRESGVSHSSFYSVFSGKDEILLSILRGHRDDFEDTMVQLLHADSNLEKLWVMFVRCLALAEQFGPSLMGALFQLELEGKFSLSDAVNTYVSRYQSWFLRFVADCQKGGVIRNPGDPAVLVPLGVKLSIYLTYEWCASGGAFSLREQAFREIEDFYDVDPAHRGIRPV